MEEDEIALDAQRGEVGDALFEMLEKLWVEACEVPVARRFALKWETLHRHELTP
jgi:hypothetical protein